MSDNIATRWTLQYTQSHRLLSKTRNRVTISDGREYHGPISPELIDDFRKSVRFIAKKFGMAHVVQLVLNL